jgi:para-nitrobenzyl esterase
MLSPAAKGLFQRAIMQSGALLNAAPLDFAEARGVRFAAAAGCGQAADVAACLRALPAGAITKLSGTAGAASGFVSLSMVDGTVVPGQAAGAFAAGQFSAVPVMLGSVADEGAFVVSINEYFNGPLTAAQYEAKVKAAYGGAAGPGGSPPAYPPGTGDLVLAHYPVGDYANPSLAWVAVLTDPSACRTRRLDQILSEKVPVYAYEFADRSAPWYFPPLSFAAGAAHTADIGYLFAGWHGGPTGERHSLSRAQVGLSQEMIKAWTRFIATGDAGWPKYEAAKDLYWIEKLPRSVMGTTHHQCEFWDKTQIY